VVLFVAETLQRAGADGDADVRGDEGARTSHLVRSFLDPSPRLHRLGRQHPVEQYAVGDCATKTAQPWPHGRQKDARSLRKELT
jgi:hypothetical protein